jgi:hypothetical protein
MKAILKSKRGIVMESAILFMVVMFMFGFLLTGVAMTAHLRVKANNAIIAREMEIEQIGENFVNMNDTDFTKYIETKSNYTATLGEKGGNRTLTLKRNSKTVLYVEAKDTYVEANGTTVTTVIVWKYSIEENQNG